MPGPVERWLETFMCTQYAELFNAYGFKTLQSVCQLQMSHLQSMGIPPAHSDIIYQNVEVLRQSIQGPFPYGEESYLRNRMSHAMQNPAYEAREHQQMNSMNMNYNQQMNMRGNYGNQRPMMRPYPGSGPCPQNQPNPQQQQAYPMSGFKQEYSNTNFQRQTRPNSEMEYPNNCFPRPSNPFSQVPGGGPGMGQVNMHHPHLHRNSAAQNPQEVANNILQMASSTYPPNNTVQVPLSKNRSAPYHVPQRAGHYPVMSTNDTHLQQQQQIQQMQYSFPVSSPQMHLSPHSTMSPVSPASATVMSSPHSIHSGHSVPSSSPASMHSPRMGCVRSPGLDMMRTPEGSGQSMMNQQINSPQRNQYPMPSPVGTPHSRMVSPIPVNQQLQVSTSSSITNQFHQNYRDMSNMASPSGSTPKSHYSSFSNIQPSPGGQSVNMSSPYTPGSHTSPGSPNQMYNNSLYIRDSGSQGDSNQQTSGTDQVNPLQSLQKLCMLPETRVIDPKSVVNDTCAPSPQDVDGPKNLNSHNDYHQQSFNGCHTGSGGFSSETSRNSQPVNDMVTEQPDHTSDNGDRSVSNTLSSETHISSESFNSGASNLADNIQTSDETVTQVSCNTNTFTDENIPMQNNPPKDTDQLNGQSLGVNNSEFQNDVIEQNMTDQSDRHAEHEEFKCQPKKLKLLRATNQTHGNYPYEQETTLAENLSESQNGDVDPSKNIVRDADVTVPEVFSTEDEKGDASKDIGKPGSPPFFKSESKTEIIEDSSQAEYETALELPPEEEIGDPLKEDVTTKINGDYTVDSGVSDSDEDSHLSVRKDMKTYSRADRYKPIEHATRFRKLSGGSVSDEVIESDIEYEDHIGCDDIENNFSDLEEKVNCETTEDTDYMEIVPEVDRQSDIMSVNKAKSKHVICSPHWKKSKLNNLNSVDTDRQEKVESCNGSYTNKRKNGVRKKKPVIPLNGIIEINDMEMEVPSPSDINDVSIENRDGTMFLTQSHRLLHRKRKTPLKYRDTSFFKGDFMFDDEDDAEFKPKLSKKSNGVDFNHNTATGDKGTKGEKTHNKSKDKGLTNGARRDHLLNSSQDLKLNKSTDSKSKNRKSDTDHSGQPKNEFSTEDDLKHSDTNLSKKLTEGNESENVSYKRGNKAKSSVKRSNRSTVVSNPSNKTAKKEKGALSVKSKSTVQMTSTPQTSGVRAKVSRLKVPQSDTSKVKSLNGLKSMKETRNKTKNCSFENQNQTEEDEVTVNKVMCSNSVSNVTNSDCESDIILIDDEEEDDYELNVCHDKISPVKKELSTATVDSKLSKLTCDVNISESESESSFSSKQIKTNKELYKTSKQKQSGSKSKSKTKSQKKNKISQKSQKKFIFESDEEFDPSHSSLKALNLSKTQHLLKKSRNTKKPDNRNTFKGPLVRLEGKKEAPDKCVVMNERSDSTSAGKTKAVPQTMATSVQISHLPSDKSVLVPQASAEEGNQWLCALCGKHSSYRYLGDLFGPYTVEGSIASDSGTNKDGKPKKRKSEESLHSGNKPSRTSRRVDGVSRELDSWKEVWVHESCSVWSDGVYLIGSKIYGLQEAITIAGKTPCTHCLEMGAMIGCLNKGCKEKYHYSCAVDKDCYLDEENLSLLCPRHKVKKLKPQEPSTSSSVT